MKKEEFPLDTIKVKKLTELFQSKGYTGRLTKNRYVYVNLSMVRLQIMWILPKILYAMGVAREIDAQVVVITWRENRLLDELLDALGVDHLCIEVMDRKDIGSMIKAICKTTGFLLFHKNGAELQQLKIDRYPLGKALYEDIIRTSSLSTIRTVRNKICVKKMVHITWMICALQKYLRKRNPVFCVADDIAYHESVQNAVFYRNGAEIYSQHIYGESRVIFDGKCQTVRRGRQWNRLIREKMSGIGEEEIKQTEELLQEKFKGRVGRDIDRGAFSGKKVVSREETEKLLGLDRGKKNAVIMAHTFTDAVFNYGDLYFRDYYDWLEQTLKIAGETDQVNWILKPHPTRKVYNEDTDSIENMYDRLKRENIYLLPDEVSAESIRDIADVIVTIGGNAGGEFSCFGIPAVIVGVPYYKGFGYTVEPESRDAYEDVIRHIDTIETLSEEQIKTAKKVYYLKSVLRLGKEFHDEFAEILLGKNREMSDKIATKLFESNQGTKDYNNEITEKIIAYFREHEIEDCEYYQRGMLRGKECRNRSDKNTT